MMERRSKDWYSMRSTGTRWSTEGSMSGSSGGGRSSLETQPQGAIFAVVLGTTGSYAFEPSAEVKK